MTIRRFVGPFFAAALLLAPVAVQAQSCSALTSERASLQSRMAQLVATYPGTHFVIGMCAAGASNTFSQTHDSNQATQNFAVCAGIGCALVGFQSCADVASQWFSMAIEDSEISDKLKGC
jgi:Mn2+/Fe2+ NRAMP family transporter